MAQTGHIPGRHGLVVGEMVGPVPFLVVQDNGVVIPTPCPFIIGKVCTLMAVFAFPRPVPQICAGRFSSFSSRPFHGLNLEEGAHNVHSHDPSLLSHHRKTGRVVPSHAHPKSLSTVLGVLGLKIPQLFAVSAAFLTNLPTATATTSTDDDRHEPTFPVCCLSHQ